MFTKDEIIARTANLRAEDPNFRADLNMAVLIASAALFEQKLWSGRDYSEHCRHGQHAL